jgi:hypothetical protein
MANFLLERKQDLSIIYWLKELFEDIPDIGIVDGYPEGDLELPSIAVEAEDIFFVKREMGNRRGDKHRLWSIDVYGNNKTQRDFMAYKILQNIENGIEVSDFDEGFPPDSNPSQLGTLRPVTESITATPIRIFPELVEKLYWRYRIRFITEYHSL